MDGLDEVSIHCDVCLLVFRGKPRKRSTAERYACMQLTKHWRLKHSPKAEKLVCDLCESTFGSVQNFTRHVAKQHNMSVARKLKITSVELRGKLEITCDSCNNIVKSCRRGIAKHLRRCSMFPQRGAYAEFHVPVERKAYRRICDDCDKTFEVTAFSKHWSGRHSGQKAPLAYFCDRCPFAARWHGNLITHARRRRCW